MRNNQYESGVSVIMPTYKQSKFISRAINSLISQSFLNWELIIIIDGCNETEKSLSPYLNNNRVRIIKNSDNRGLGAAINIGLKNSIYNLISYLPSDDIYYQDHLSSLYAKWKNSGDKKFVVSGMMSRFTEYLGKSYGERSNQKLTDYPIQLVQVLHEKISGRWLERSEIESDDLYKLYWNNFISDVKPPVWTNQITCEWTDHPMQRHKIINEFLGGGIFKFKKYYNIKHPIIYKSVHGNLIDEINDYKPFQNNGEQTKDGLKILLVGELSYNPERICSFEQRGHKLYGLWMPNPSNHTTIGPLPFGNVEDVEYSGWKSKVEELKPDIIYAQSNYHAIPIAHEVLTAGLDIPFVWQLKESPFHARQKGMWDKLIDLYKLSDGHIYHTEFIDNWYRQFLNRQNTDFLVLDGELPAKPWFTSNIKGLLSEQDGEIHTVFAGRPVGFGISEINKITAMNIHLHFYGDIFHTAYGQLLKKAHKRSPNYIHFHPNCDPKNWVNEFSQYDAGWLHLFKSNNNKELIKANWLDLNIPARFSTYAMAGIPVIQFDNDKHIVASQSLANRLQVGVFFKTFKDLKIALSDKAKMNRLRSNMWHNRFEFCFDNYTDNLIEFFNKTINLKK